MADPSPLPSPEAHALWARVVERIIHGFAHGLNNRLLVLMGGRDLLEPPASADAELLALLDGELDGLDSDVRLMRRLVVRDSEAEPTDPAELLEASRRLMERHRSVRQLDLRWEVPGGLPAVEVVPSAALRALLLLAAGAAEGAGEQSVVLEARVAGDGLVIEVVGAAPPPPAHVEAARLELGSGSGRLEEREGRPMLVLPVVRG